MPLSKNIFKGLLIYLKGRFTAKEGGRERESEGVRKGGREIEFPFSGSLHMHATTSIVPGQEFHLGIP